MSLDRAMHFIEQVLHTQWFLTKVSGTCSVFLQSWRGQKQPNSEFLENSQTRKKKKTRLVYHQVERNHGGGIERGLLLRGYENSMRFPCGMHYRPQDTSHCYSKSINTARTLSKRQRQPSVFTLEQIQILRQFRTLSVQRDQVT